MKPILCVAGRSGGHIIPCLTYAESIKKPEQQLVIVTSRGKLDATIAQNFESIKEHLTLPLENVPRSLVRFPLFLFQLIRSTFSSLYYLIKHRPAVIVTTGGYIAIPVCLMGKLLRIPVELFELNVIPGKAIKFLAPVANTVHTCFATTNQFIKKGTLGSYPIKQACFKEQPTKEQLIQELGFEPNRKTILILGGSQGSQALNTLFAEMVIRNRPESWQIIHQVGNHDPEQLKLLYKEYGLPAHVFSFDHHLERFYGVADLVICRSGAGTLFETLHFKKQCITIPLQAATTSHQKDNAQAFVQEHPTFFRMLEQTLLEQNPQLFYESVVAVLEDVKSG